MHDLPLIAQQSQPWSMSDKQYIPATWWNVERLKPRTGWARQDNAGKKAERLADRNALRALAPEVAPPSAASGSVCPVDDAAEAFVEGVVVAPDDVPADHAGLFLVAGVVGAVEREIAQRGELGFYAV